jgi:hypothetical protein
VRQAIAAISWPRISSQIGIKHGRSAVRRHTPGIAGSLWAWMDISYRRKSLENEGPDTSL